MSRPHILLTRRWPAAVEAHLAERYDVTVNADDHPMSAAEMAEAMRTHDAVCPTVTDIFDASVIGTDGVRARIVGNYGVGYNHVDVEACRRAGITVTNTPDVLTDATADLALTLLLMVARRAGEGERMVRADAWPGWAPTQMIGRELNGKTLGLIGFGRIAQATAARAHHGFGMRIAYSAPRRQPAAIETAVLARYEPSVDALIEQSDFLSLHCPGGSATHHLINAERIARMKPGAILINTARGTVVDERALAAALAEGRIAGAGLDVYETEPKVEPALLGLENVVLLPHLGSATAETRVAMGMRVARNLDAFFAGETPPDRIA
ncbi:MAG: D-glycerate dehydrogenase [Sphingomonas bacterium]|nr:D-glycerate dehydrogenase [Sphingomonas bacterium]